MLKSKRLFVLSGVTGLLAAMAFAVPSQAAKAVCAVNGTAKTVDKEDEDIGVRIRDGKGTFSFESSTGGLGLQCVETEKEMAVETGSAEAEGWYDNLICGTGKAVGTVTGVTNDKYAWLAEDEHRFSVEIIGGQGEFYWEDDKTGKEGPEKLLTPFLNDEQTGDPDKNAEGDWVYAGQISLTEKNATDPLGTDKPPSRPPNPDTGHCVDGFDVVGSIIVHEP